MVYILLYMVTNLMTVFYMALSGPARGVYAPAAFQRFPW
jgi:hypothetical protein